MKMALILDENDDWRILLVTFLKKCFDCDTREVRSADELKNALSQTAFALLILGSPVTLKSAGELTRSARSKNPNAVVIFQEGDTILQRTKDFITIRKSDYKKLLDVVEQETKWPRLYRPS